MPPPPPPPKPYWFDTAGLSAEQIVGMDPDYLYFLRHVRLVDDAYEVEIPSRDGASPPLVVRYEEPQPLVGPNAATPADAGSEQGHQSASSPSMEIVSSAAAAEPVSVDVEEEEEEEALAGPNAKACKDGSDHGDLDAPSPMGMGSSAAAEVPTGAAPLPDIVQQVATATSPDDGIGCGPLLADADKTALPATTEPAWYDFIPNIDESYRLFLERSSATMNHSTSALEMGGVPALLEEADQLGDGHGEERGEGHGEEQKEGPEEEEEVQRQEEPVRHAIF